MEWHNHIEQEQGVEQFSYPIVYAHNPPCSHVGAQNNQRNRSHCNKEGPSKRGEEVRGFNTARIVLKPHKGFARRKSESVFGNICLLLEGVDEYQNNRENPQQAENSEECRPESTVLDRIIAIHYACTSLLVVSLFWIKAITATKIKKRTALAWPTPSQPIRP